MVCSELHQGHQEGTRHQVPGATQSLVQLGPGATQSPSFLLCDRGMRKGQSDLQQEWLLSQSRTQ